MGAVGVPVWLWTQPWTAQSATASAGGISVTVTAKISKVTWAMGDGSKVVCATRGTPVRRRPWGSGTRLTAATCTRGPPRAQPGAKYTVTARALWNVDLDGRVHRHHNCHHQSTTQLAIGEYQVIVTG